MRATKEIGFGGGCHWCTEAVFQSLKGVLEVNQGYIASTGEASSYSEGVLITYNPEIIPLATLLEIHLHTHKSTSNHSFRKKYRSAVYVFNHGDAEKAHLILKQLQKDFEEKIVTQVLPFNTFEASRESLQDYFLKNPEKPFCQRYIHPKLEFLKKKFSREIILR